MMHVGLEYNNIYVIISQLVEVTLAASLAYVISVFCTLIHVCNPELTHNVSWDM